MAALTSSISILEVVVAYFKEEFKMKRNNATVLAAILISILGVFCSLSMGVLNPYKVFGLNLFDLVDWISANMLLPLGGLFIALFIGWKLGIRKTFHELRKGSSYYRCLLHIFIFLVKFIAPIAISIVFLNGIGLLKF